MDMDSLEGGLGWPFYGGEREKENFNSYNPLLVYRSPDFSFIVSAGDKIG